MCISIANNLTSLFLVEGSSQTESFRKEQKYLSLAPLSKFFHFFFFWGGALCGNPWGVLSPPVSFRRSGVFSEILLTEFLGKSTWNGSSGSHQLFGVSTASFQSTCSKLPSISHCEPSGYRYTQEAAKFPRGLSIVFLEPLRRKKCWNRQKGSLSGLRMIYWKLVAVIFRNCQEGSEEFKQKWNEIVVT